MSAGTGMTVALTFLQAFVPDFARPRQACALTSEPYTLAGAVSTRAAGQHVHEASLFGPQ